MSQIQSVDNSVMFVLPPAIGVSRRRAATIGDFRRQSATIGDSRRRSATVGMYTSGRGPKKVHLSASISSSTTLRVLVGARVCYGLYTSLYWIADVFNASASCEKITSCYRVYSFSVSGHVMCLLHVHYRDWPRTIIPKSGTLLA